MHGPGLAPSSWVTRWAGLVAPGGTVLDVACGSGRHFTWLAQRGFRVTGVDRDAAAVEPLRALGEAIVADIENGPWPLDGRRFDAVVVTNYLWRALLPRIAASLAPGGALIYETFTREHATIGRPSNPDFLLAAGELPAAFADLRTVAYEDGFVAADAAGGDRFVQRLAAVTPPVGPPGAPPPRYRLAG